MFVLYTFCTLIGVSFAALSYLRLGPAPADKPSDEAAAPTAGCRRHWALPLAVFGLVGLTLHLLGRPFMNTLVLSLVVGPPVGLVAAFVSGRISRDK